MTDVSHTRNAWRRLGYRLLPRDGFSYILHLRPAEWPIMAAHTLLVSYWQSGSGRLSTARGWGLPSGVWPCGCAV